MPEPKRALGVRASDWLVELLLVPAAMGTVFWALWHAAFLASPGQQYGVGAIVLSVLWFFVLFAVDLNRYRKRSALLLLVPVIVPVAVCWSAVANVAMAQRGIVEECPVSAEVSYEVTDKYGTHWEREYTLACDSGSPEVVFRVAEPEKSTDGYGFDDHWSYDDGLDSLEVEYDPEGLLEPRTEDFVSEREGSPAGTLYFAAFLAAVAIGVRVAAARAWRSDD